MTATAHLARSPVPRPDVRHRLRELLSAQQGFGALDPAMRRDLASGLARIGSLAVDHDELAARPGTALAVAQDAGSAYSGTAIDRMAGTTRAVLNAVSFPRFVTELITGVFKAMNDSNQQQLTAFVDLIRNVAQTTEGFADSNVGIAGARQWLAEHFPTAYEVTGDDEAADDADELAGLPPDERRQRQQELQAERDASTRLALRAGATPPAEAALRTALGLGPGDAVTAADPERLVPLAQQVLARNRQQLLATMVQMGLQRIVIESGRLNAAMNFHIDASSVAANDRGSQFDTRNTVGVSGGARFGPWGAEANVQSTIGYVSTDRTQTTESSHADLNLSSGVELVFRTDYVPLNRLAGVGDVERIRVNTINPDAEAARLSADRAAQRSAEQADMAARRTALDGGLRAPPAVGSAGSGGAGSGAAGSGAVGSGAAGSGAAGSGAAGSGAVGSGSAGSGSAASGSAGSGPAASGSAASGSAGSAHTSQPASSPPNPAPASASASAPQPPTGPGAAASRSPAHPATAAPRSPAGATAAGHRAAS
ncbi:MULTISPECIES: hypothetical protein [unclassified Burkholderia]|uniref:hypothetical protein n=2 Tax=unclassified Burkholderia TaxID=2613784 RepID=UPI000F57D310|nr:MULTISPECIES: hypothetical protein [unclassified Burkholderia]